LTTGSYPVFADHIPVPGHFHILWKRSDLRRNLLPGTIPQFCHILGITFAGFVDDPGNRTCIHGNAYRSVNAFSTGITFFITCQYRLFSPGVRFLFAKKMRCSPIAQWNKDHTGNPNSNQIGHPVISITSTSIFPYPFSYEKGDQYNEGGGKYKADQSLHGRKKCQRYNSQYQDPISHKSILFTFQGPFKILFRKRLSLLYGRHISMTPAKQPYIRRCPGNDHTCQQQSQKKLHGICKQFPWILQILIHSPYF